MKLQLAHSSFATITGLCEEIAKDGEIVPVGR